MSFLSRLKPLAKDLLPPLVTRMLTRRQRLSLDKGHAAAMDAFYSSLVAPDTLCFDIGANVGNRVAVLRRLNLPVIAAEPQPQCYARLQTDFGADRGVTLVNKAVGSAVGRATMQVSDLDMISSMSQTFIDTTASTGRFDKVMWDKSITVEVTTLDELIREYGVPGFVKIDVEGYELEVVRGLSRPINLISLEWIPELTHVLLDCVEHLARLGPVEYNLSWGESMKLGRSRWMDEGTLRQVLEVFRDETVLFGDVYIRSKTVA